MVTKDKDDENPLDSTYEKMLKSLGDDDPNAFEEAKNEIIEEFIMTHPPETQKRLRQKQWLIDNELRKFKDPTARLNRMVEMFWSQVREFQASLLTLEHPEMAKIEKPKKEKAKVIDITKKV